MTTLHRTTILLLLALALGTSPLPPPYSVYVVEGRIDRTGGGPRGNFTVVLAGKLHNSAGTEFTRIAASSGDLHGGAPVALTDSNGAFRLQARSDDPADSLRLEVILPGRTAITGAPFIAGEVPGEPTTETVTYDPDGDFLDCSPDRATRRIVLFTTYRFTERTINIPF